MSLKIALIISLILQFIAAIIAISLIKRTRWNIAWWLISFGFLLMAVRRLFDIFIVFDKENFLTNSHIITWLGIVTSVLMLISLYYIRRIFNIQKKYELLKEKNEAKVFSAIIKTEENLKHKFSKELHDGLGPLLASVKMSITSISQSVVNEKNKDILNHVENLIDESINTVKEISNNLSPHILNNFGLLKAVDSFITKWKTGPKFNINSNLENSRFSYNIETVAYRVVCELITNSLKHAEAQNIFLDMILENGILNIKYMDDGVGFDFNSTSEDLKGHGLTNIQSRIKSVNGTYEIFTMPGQGFNINIFIKTE